MITRKSTKELLVESVLELMEAKPVNRITIRNITENCGMSRHAFYYYFDPAEFRAYPLEGPAGGYAGQHETEAAVLPDGDG